MTNQATAKITTLSSRICKCLKVQYRRTTNKCAYIPSLNSFRIAVIHPFIFHAYLESGIVPDFKRKERKRDKIRQSILTNSKYLTKHESSFSSLT